MVSGRSRCSLLTARSSISTARILGKVSERLCVKAPSPGPNSKTGALGSTLSAKLKEIFFTVLGSCR